MFENIYFVYFGALQHFLTIIEPGKSNLIIIQDVPYLKQFLNAILPDETIITVPEIESRRISKKNKKRFFQCLLDIIITRTQIPAPLKTISPKAEVFLFLEVGSLSFFILCQFLQKKDATVNYVDAGSPINYNHSIPYNRLSKSLRFELWFLQILSGVRLAWFEAPYKPKLKIIGLRNHTPPLELSPMLWGEITQKHRWHYKKDIHNAVLFIDCTIQNILGIDFNRSQKNVIDFFSQLIDKGVAIHVKGHQGSQLNSFSGTELERKVELLPTFYPVELIMNSYQKVYGINSNALKCPIYGKKFSLIKLLVFTSQERKKIVNDTFRINVGTEIDHIELPQSPIH
jgi:hypothetical protein